MRWLFVLAYTCSGLAGLVYEVSWTRLLTLYIGHTTAAASADVAAFLGGLAIGAGAGGRVAERLSRRACLIAYACLEALVGAIALLLPLELMAAAPLLRWAYDDGAPGFLFPLVRLIVCLALVLAPALALGATFPLAVRWLASESRSPAKWSGLLYAANTAGAAIGALLAGFVLIPAIGVSGSTYVGVAASIVAALSVAAVLRYDGRGDRMVSATTTAQAAAGGRRKKGRATRETAPAVVAASPSSPVLVAALLGLTGFASLMHEIAWTRILTLVLGPTIYAFAATLAAVIAGVAIGSFAGTWLVGRTRNPAAWLAMVLAAAAITASYTYSLAGTDVPRRMAQVMASGAPFAEVLQRGLLLTAALILPTAVCLGAAFPLALSMTGSSPDRVTGRFAIVYAVNTIGAVCGSLAAGFLVIPALGLQATLLIVSVCLIAAAAAVALWRLRSGGAWLSASAAGVVAIALLVASPPWDRELLASGAYLYARFVPKDLDLPALLRAGTLLYYREGAGSTVSVKRLTGTTTLAVDGKTDASNRGDMLTQKLASHLPLLLHDNPQDIAIIGLGSGVTVGAALRHPIRRADVVEISPQVVEASRFFDAENQRALVDPRTHLILADARSHLLLAKRQYDVIISEPSNPWIAGVAALFTREFFSTARDRLTPGGVICQWANAYNISDADLRSIVATFTSVFPDGTAWLVGQDDLLLVASRDPHAAGAGGAGQTSGGGRAGAVRSVTTRLADMKRHWSRPGVAADLETVAARQPFAILSLLVGGPAELARYGQGAAILTDDRMTLEFSGPREIHGGNAGENSAALMALLGDAGGPQIVRDARAAAGASEWRERARMMSQRDAHAIAYDDYLRALQLDRSDRGALDGLVRTAVLLHRGADALAWVKSLAQSPAGRGAVPVVDFLIAQSKLLASIGESADAIDMARQAARTDPESPAPLEQLASIFADAGDTGPLEAVVDAMRNAAPDRPATHYYAAALAFLRGDASRALEQALQATVIDPQYAAAYDIIGAAHTRLGAPDAARAAFQRSLSFDAHDSTAYTNLGVIELAAGNRRLAANYFAEALWLAPDSATARQGLQQAR